VKSPQVTRPLRQRMMDDMRMRRLALIRQANYRRVVREFIVFLDGLLDTAPVEDLRRYQLHLVDQGVSPVSLYAAITGLKFFFGTTLDPRLDKHGHRLRRFLRRKRDLAARRGRVDRVWRYSNNSNLLLAIGAPLKRAERTDLESSNCACARYRWRPRVASLRRP
jgi:hypothetical protein